MKKGTYPKMETGIKLMGSFMECDEFQKKIAMAYIQGYMANHEPVTPSSRADRRDSA